MRPMTDADICRANEWGSGTRLTNAEGTVIEITAVGYQVVLACVVSHEGQPRSGSELIWTLTRHDWREVSHDD